MEKLSNSECLDDAQHHTGKRGEVKMREEPAGVDSVLCKCSCEPECSTSTLFPRCVTKAQSDMGLVPFWIQFKS